MEWDFTTSQVIKGEVDYPLTQFLADLKGEIEYNFPKFESDERRKLYEMTYSIVYLAALRKTPQEIHETSTLPLDLVTSLLANNEANIRMLEAIFMGMFLKRLEKLNGYIGDAENLELLNAEIHSIHATNFLQNHD